MTSATPSRLLLRDLGGNPAGPSEIHLSDRWAQVLLEGTPAFQARAARALQSAIGDGSYLVYETGVCAAAIEFDPRLDPADADTQIEFLADQVRSLAASLAAVGTAERRQALVAARSGECY